MNKILERCQWCLSSKEMIKYPDEEWGWYQNIMIEGYLNLLFLIPFRLS